MLFAGVTAATRALVARKDPIRAFRIGAVGGAVHFGGKLVASNRRAASAILGIALGGIGSSLVANAGRGTNALSELQFPIGPARVRLSKLRGTLRVRVAINAYEAAVIGRYLADRDFRIDWHRTAALGTLAFETRGGYLVVAHGDTVDGTSTASIVAFSAFATEPDKTERHEIAHVHQQWFLEENWGRPIEEGLRSRVPGMRYLPQWLELGIVSPSILWLEERSLGYRRGPIVRLLESEAEWFERR